MGHRSRLPILLLAGLALAVAAAGPGASETITSRYTGRTYEVFSDSAADEKWIRGPDGTRYADLREVYDAELREIGDPKARIDPDLWRDVYGPGDGRTPRQLILILADQPLHRTGGRPPAGSAARVRAWRREVIAETARLAAASREDVLDRLEGRHVVGTSDLLNAIFLVAPPEDLPDLLVNNPEIWCVQAAEIRETQLNVSVPTTSAGTFWSGTYTGSGIAVCVLDTGMDNLHPALKAAIGKEKVFLGNGKNSSNFNDDATTTDDLHGHGTHCGGIVASRDSTYAGVAKGATLVNAKAGYLTTSGQGSLNDYDIFDATHWAADKTDVFSLSFGGSGGSGNSALAKLYDAAVHGLSIHVAAAAGNSGPTAKTVLSPGDAFNVVTVGASNDKGTTSISDNLIASFSSRGPTADGRRKPTLTAPGYLIYSASQKWETGADFRNMSGTSMACPHMAGALALVMDYDAAWKPEAIKALLLNTARNASPYPTTPDDTWGWGGLDLDAAYDERTSVHEGSLTSTGAASVYFVRTSSIGSGDRATLVWNRHVVFPSSGTPGTPPSLMDLDLYLYDGKSGAEHAKSASTVSPVEQVKASGTVDSPVLRVRRISSFPTGANGFTDETFAVAAPSGFTQADATELEITIDGPEDPLGPGSEFSVTVTVRNRGGVPAIDPVLALTMAEGFTRTSGDAETTLDTIEGGVGVQVVYSVKAPAISATGSITASVASSGFGLDVSAGPVGASVSVDAIGPSGTVVVNDDAAYTNRTDVTLRLTATDAHSGVDRMRLAAGDDEWGDWQDYALTRSITIADGDGLRSARAQFRDRAGNVSPVVSDTIELDTTAPVGSVVLNGGATFTNAAGCTAALAATDSGSGVADFRRRVGTGAFAAWESMATSHEVPLPGSDGERVVEIRYRDGAGNVSEAARDSIVVDRTAPTVSVTIGDGSASVNSSRVTIAIAATDNLSGLEAMLVEGGKSGASTWEAPAVERDVELPPGEGDRTIRVRVRDRAGNVSSVATDAVLVDLTPPTGSFLVNDDALYVLPGDPLRLTVDASDGPMGSGVRGAVIRFDGDWSDEYDLRTAREILVAGGDRPAGAGYLVASLELIDEAGNRSVPIDTRFTAIPMFPPAAAKKLSGALGYAEEVTAFALDLVRGDTLSVKLKGKPLNKGDLVETGLELVRPDGRRLIDDRYPRSRATVGIDRYYVPETGRYFLLIRRSAGAPTCRWTAKVKVKQSKTTKKLAGTAEVFRFDAANGSTLKGTVSADGLVAEDITIVGPEGAIPFTGAVKNGRAKFPRTLLTAGTGTYEIRLAGRGPATFKLTSTRPK